MGTVGSQMSCKPTLLALSPGVDKDMAAAGVSSGQGPSACRAPTSSRDPGRPGWATVQAGKEN